MESSRDSTRPVDSDRLLGGIGRSCLSLSLHQPRGPWDRRLEIILVVLATVVAAISAEPFAFSPNDGSRLASVEALVDYGTLSIDRSIFVVPPPPEAPPEHHGYHPAAVVLRAIGTVDKVFVRDDYNLRLMSPKIDRGSIPTTGHNLVIVVAVDRVLHFRIFDGDGKIVVDKDETTLTGKTQE